MTSTLIIPVGVVKRCALTPLNFSTAIWTFVAEDSASSLRRVLLGVAGGSKGDREGKTGGKFAV